VILGDDRRIASQRRTIHSNPLASPLLSRSAPMACTRSCAPLFGSSLTLALALSSIGCTSDTVRARAAVDLACSEDRLSVIDVGGSAFHVYGCGRDVRYVCSGGASPVIGGNGGWVSTPVTCTREGADSSEESPSASSNQSPGSSNDDDGTGLPITAASFPKGVAGFDFGLPRAAAESACTAAGHVIEPDDEDKDVLSCSQPVASVGFDASVKLTFCDGGICRVDIFTRSEGSEAWAKRFGKLRRTLEQRYGRPTRIKRKIPDRCVTELASCLAEGTAGFWITWKWSSSDLITLAMAKRGESPVIRITYKREGSGDEPAL
jgi:hypothetical protein